MFDPIGELRRSEGWELKLGRGTRVRIGRRRGERCLNCRSHEVRAGRFAVILRWFVRPNRLCSGRPFATFGLGGRRWSLRRLVLLLLLLLLSVLFEVLCLDFFACRRQEQIGQVFIHDTVVQGPKETFTRVCHIGWHRIQLKCPIRQVGRHTIDGPCVKWQRRIPDVDSGSALQIGQRQRRRRGWWQQSPPQGRTSLLRVFGSKRGNVHDLSLPRTPISEIDCCRRICSVLGVPVVVTDRRCERCQDLPPQFDLSDEGMVDRPDGRRVLTGRRKSRLVGGVAGRRMRKRRRCGDRRSVLGPR